MDSPVALVVEDDLWVRRVLCEILTDEGVTVLTAATAAQALQRLQGCRPRLVVLDTGAAAVDLAREMQVVLGATPPPLVLISAEAELAATARRAGALACLRKPFDLEQFLAAVRCGLGRT